MRIIVSLLDGNMRKGTVEEDTLIRDLAARLKLEPNCCLTLAGIPLEGDRCIGEYGIQEGMELEVEKIGKKASGMDLGGKGRAGKPGDTHLDRLIGAAKDGDLDTVKEVVESRAVAINDMCPFTSLTAVGAAAGGGHEDVIKYLISKKGSVNKERTNMYPPLHAAASKGNEAIATLLIEAGAKLDAQEDVVGQTALHAAIDRKQAHMVPFLAKKRGCNIEQCDFRGVSPLAQACAKGELEAVQFLLAQKANINTENDKGQSPLGTACNKGYVDVVRTLLQAGARVDAQAIFAVLMTENEEIEAILADAGSSPDSCNLDGKTCVHVAAKDGATELCAYIADQGGDVDQQDSNGVTPLMCAAEGGHKGCTRFLLSRGADVNIRDNNRDSALHYAGWYDKPKVFEILVKVGKADPEVVNNKNEKPKSPNAGEKCTIM